MTSLWSAYLLALLKTMAVSATIDNREKWRCRFLTDGNELKDSFDFRTVGLFIVTPLSPILNGKPLRGGCFPSGSESKNSFCLASRQVTVKCQLFNLKYLFCLYGIYICCMCHLSLLLFRLVC